MSSLKLCKGETCLRANPNGLWKVLDEFYSNKCRKDGRDNYCKLCQSKRRKERYRQNQEKEKDYSRKYVKENPEKVRKAIQKWKKENRDRINSYSKEWKRNNKEKTNSYSHNRRARLAGASGGYTVFEWDCLCARYNWCCLRCGLEKQLTVDHIVPIDRGGSNYIHNIQPLCGPCNKKKGTKNTDYRY